MESLIGETVTTDNLHHHCPLAVISNKDLKRIANWAKEWKVALTLVKAKADITSSAACLNPRDDFALPKEHPLEEGPIMSYLKLFKVFLFSCYFGQPKYSFLWEWLIFMQHVDKIVPPVLFLQKFQLRGVEQNNFSRILQVRRREKSNVFMFASLLSDSIHVTYFGPLQCATRKA